MGGVAKRIWKRAKFTVRQGHDRTEFIFFVNFNIARKIKKTELSVYLQLLGPQRSSFKKVLTQAWRRGLYGQERIRDLVDRLLFKIFSESLSALYEEANSLEPYKGYLGDGREAVRKASKRTRRPTIVRFRNTAKRVANRYTELLPMVRELRETIKTHPQLPNESLLIQALAAR